MKQLHLKYFIDYQYLSNLLVSPNKGYYSFVVAKANLASNEYNYNLYLGNKDGHKQILNLKSANYFWENEDNILYLDSVSESEKGFVKLNNSIVYRYNHKEDKKEIAYTFNFNVSNIEVLDENQLLIFANLNEDDYELMGSDIERLNYLSKLENNTDYEEVSEIPFYFDGGTFLKAKRRQVFVYDIKADTLVPLLEKDVSLSIYTFNDDKSVLYFSTTTYDNKPSNYNNIYKYDVVSKEVSSLYDKLDFGVNKLFVLNDQLYTFGSDKKDYGINQNPDLYKVVDNELEFVEKFSRSAHNSVGSDSRFGIFNEEAIINDKYYFIGTYQDKNILYSYDLNSIKSELEVIGSLDSFVYYDDKFLGII